MNKIQNAASILGKVGGIASAKVRAPRSPELQRKAALARWAKAKPISERFWAKVKKAGPDQCWEWQGCRLPGGYGHFRMNGKVKIAHRVSWELSFQEIPKEIDCLHRCDNPPCCNPAHLFLGTHQQNMTDMAQKRRGTNGEKHPLHKLKNGDILEIRKLCEQGVPHSEIARRFNTNKARISRIKNRILWSHV